MAVFGEGRIALELISAEEGAPQKFLSFSLSQFRTLAKAIREGTSWTNFAEGSGIPLQSEQSTLACHYLETPVFELQQLPYYQTDKDFTLEVSGYRCQSCGLVVSENGRKRENWRQNTGLDQIRQVPQVSKAFWLWPALHPQAWSLAGLEHGRFGRYNLNRVSSFHTLLQ